MLFDDLFDDFFDDWFETPYYTYYDPKYEKKLNKALKKEVRNDTAVARRAARMMKTDVKEKKDCYEVEIDLPGYTKDEVKVELENGYLTVSAEKGEGPDENTKFLRRERYTGYCSRSFYVGGDMEQSDIKASFHHGTLKLVIPKKKAEEAPEIEENKYISIE